METPNGAALAVKIHEVADRLFAFNPGALKTTYTAFSVIPNASNLVESLIMFGVDLAKPLTA